MFYTRNSTVYVVESPRDNAGVFFIFKGIVQEHNNKNMYIISNLEYKGTKESYKKFVRGAHFKSTDDLEGYRTYKKMSNMGKFKLATHGRQIFSRFTDALNYRKKLEYDFMLYALEMCKFICSRENGFTKYHKNIDNMINSLNYQRVQDEIQKMKKCQ